MLPKSPSPRSFFPSPSRSLPAFFFSPCPSSRPFSPVQASTLRPLFKNPFFVELSAWASHAKSLHSYSLCIEALKLSASYGSLDEGRVVHGCIVKQGFTGQFLQLQLLDAYVKSRSLCHAYQLFVEVPTRDVVSWNMLISGFNRSGGELLDRVFFMEIAGLEELQCFTGWHLSILSFRKMLGEMVWPDYITLISVLSACVGLNDVDIGKQVHCYVTKCGFCSDRLVGTCMVDLYAKFGLVRDAVKMFDAIEFRDMVLWNVLISCYNLNGLHSEAFQMFELMRHEGRRGDGFTFTILLNSCSGLGSRYLGQQMHALVIQSGHGVGVFVGSAIVDVYAKSHNMKDARMAFDQMVVRNTVSWATLIVGYGSEGDGSEAIRLYRRMVMEGYKPDEIMLASLLSSCANMAAASGTVQFHAHVIKFGVHSLSTMNALLMAYSKCGSIVDVLKSFRLISSPDVVTWSSLISSYAFHGHAKEALDSFEKMKLKGVKPDGNAYLALLSACRHAGLLEEGLHYFDSMSKEDKICPEIEHYTCLVDLLSRAGHLQEAHRVLSYMPSKLNLDALRSFISACKVHLNVELAIWATEILINTEPGESANYKLMANLYALMGQWNNVGKLRKLMRRNCMNEMPGCSWIEANDRVHIFVSGDKSHPQMIEICQILKNLLLMLKDVDLVVFDEIYYNYAYM